MQPNIPPLPQHRRHSSSWRVKCLIVCALLPTLGFSTLAVLRIFGLFYPFNVPTRSMAPAISAGDNIITEGITFLVRSPRRGDIVVFKADHTDYLQPATFYLKRIAGMPGDQLLISNGNLFIDDKLVTLTNNDGRIVYNQPAHLGSLPLQTSVTVPEDAYFLLGDNSTNSLDSRYFGSIPRNEIVGRVGFCYWPPSRFGIVR